MAIKHFLFYLLAGMVTMTCYSAPSQVKRAEESTPLQSTLGAMKSALDWLESVHDQVNLDAIIGTRIVEGRSKFLWRPSVVMMPTLSSMVATEVVVITTSGVTSGDKIVIKFRDWFYQKLYEDAPQLDLGDEAWTVFILIICGVLVSWSRPRCMQYHVIPELLLSICVKWWLFWLW